MRRREVREMSVFLERQTVRMRRGWRKRLAAVERALLSVALILAGFAALYGIYLMVFAGPTFAIRKIVVEGSLSRLTTAAIGDISGVADGDNLFWTSVSDVHARLKSNPWVKSAAVRRRPPDALWIYVEEHRPAALLLGSDGLYCVDEEGMAFKPMEADDEKGLPVLTGLGAPAAWRGDEPARAREMLSLVGLFRASAFGRELDVAEVHHDAVTGYSIVTRAGPMQICFGRGDPVERIALLDRIREAIAARPGRVQYMLANEPGRIIVGYRG